MSNYLGTIHAYEEKGKDGERWWFVAAYPSGATRYYESKDCRDKAMREYCDAHAATPGKKQNNNQNSTGRIKQMTEKQLIALLHYQMNEAIHLIEIKYEYPGILELKYNDSGGNLHEIGITPKGTLQAY